MSAEHSGPSENTRYRKGPLLSQTGFTWNAKDKCVKFKNLEMEVTNTHLTKHYEINDMEKYP